MQNDELRVWTMTAKTKEFDCVEMKDRIQAELQAEFTTRKNEFASYADFLEAKAGESPWVVQMRQRFQGEEFKT
jgi:hypothetical protein